MTKFKITLVLIAALSSVVGGTAGATPTPSYGTVFSRAEFAYVAGSLTEYTNTTASELTTGSFCTTVPSGFTQADIFLTNWSVSGPTVAPERIEMKVAKDSYTTNQFCWHAVGWEKSADTTHTNTYGWYFTILVANSTTVSVRPKSYTCDGAGIYADGECDDSVTWASAITSGWSLIGAAVKGFDLSTDNGAAINLNELGFDFSGATASGTSVSVTDPLIRFVGNSATNTAVSGSFDIDVLSESSTAFTALYKHNFAPTGQTGLDQTVVNYARPTTVAGQFLGLLKDDLFLASGTGSTTIALVCGAFGGGFTATNMTVNWGTNFTNGGSNTYSASTTVAQAVVK